jgi:hypothetical protein
VIAHPGLGSFCSIQINLTMPTVCSSTRPSHSPRSEATSKPAGLHLNKRLRLSHVQGPCVDGPSGARGKSVMPLRGRVQPCVRPVDAAPMAAGPDEVRGSDPKSPQRARSAWTPRVSPIPGSTGLSSRLTTLALPLDQRNAASRAGPRLHGRSHVGLVAREYRPGDPRGLVGKRHRYQSGRLALE